MKDRSTTLANGDDDTSRQTVELLAAASAAAAEDGIWLDVIRKMDEVYNDLLQYCLLYTSVKGIRLKICSV